MMIEITEGLKAQGRLDIDPEKGDACRADKQEDECETLTRRSGSLKPLIIEPPIPEQQYDGKEIKEGETGEKFQHFSL